MNNKFLIVGVIAVVLLGGFYFVSMQSDDSRALTGADMNKADEMMKDDADMKDEMMNKDDEMAEPMMEKEADMIDTEDDMMKDEAMMKKAGTYEMYSADKLMMAKEGDVILFFKASWCPTCRAVDVNIKQNLDNIPSGVTILELDYDKETALKQKYGVTSQHTFVQVDAEGNLVKKWSGGLTLDAVLSNL